MRLRGDEATKRYAAFLSYSRDRDAKLAVLLQRGIERFGRSWRQARVVRIFRDDASLSANTGLWSSIERALGDSSWFVLLASSEAAASKWVNRELEWWLEHNSPDRVLIVLTSGELIWDEARKDFDDAASTAAPPALHGIFAEEPRYVDARWSHATELVSDANPRLTDTVADIAATIRGIPKDELVGDAVRQQRRTARIVRAVAVGFAALFAVVVVAAVVALDQRSEARRQAKTSLARQLAATSDSVAEQDVDLALLMAVQAYETEPSPATLGALIRANTVSPKLVRYLPVGSAVATVAASGDGSVGVAGLDDGRVVRFSVADPGAPLEEVMRLERAITSVAASGDGGTIAASDGRVAFMSADAAAGEPTELRLPIGLGAEVVGVSPSGRTVAVHGEPRNIENPETISAFGVDGDALYPPRPTEDLTVVSSLILTSDRWLTMFGSGAWEERRLSDWALRRQGSPGVGAQQYTGPPSADGGFLAITAGAGTIPVFDVDGQGIYAEPEYTAEADLQATPTAMALSPGGARLAAAESGVLHVAQVAPPGVARSAALRLTGAGAVNTDGVSFAGDDHLISAAGARIVLWDLRQLDRLATVDRVPLGTGCNACGPPRLVVSDDGTAAAMAVEGLSFETPALVARLSEDAPVDEPVEFPPGEFVPPVWIDGGPAAAFPYLGDVEGEVSQHPGVHAWRVGAEGEVIVATGQGPDVGTVAVVDSQSRITVRDGVTGEVVSEIPARPGVAGAEGVAAAINPTGTVVARLVDEELTTTTLPAGEVSEPVNVPGASEVFFAGDRLLVRLGDDYEIQVRDPQATGEGGVIAGDTSFWLAPAADPQGTLLARPRANRTVVLVDLGARTTLGTLAVPDADTNKTSAAFSGDGDTLVTLTEDYAEAGDYLVERDLSPEALVAAACAAAGRPLTEEEWRRLVGVELPDRLACEP